MQKIFLTLLIGLSVTYGVEIKSIKFSGLNYISPTVAQDISGLKVGDQITGESSDKAIINLFEQGYFSDVYIEDSNGNLVVHVIEKPSIARVDIEGVVTNDRDAIKQLIAMNPGQIYDPVLVERTKQKIKQFYEAKGFFDTVVEVGAKPLNENQNSLHVTTKVNRGENIIIKNVNLEGATVFDYSDIEPAVANKEREIFGWMWGFNDGKVKVDELSNDPIRIKEEYYKKGYLDASVSNPFLSAYMDNYSADITYYITEGEKYTVSGVSIEAPEFLELNTEEILKDFKLQEGDRMNSAWLRKDISTLENIVADLGYAYVSVVPQTMQNKENHTVSIKYKVIPEDKVHIKDVTISGNDKTADKVIRREMYLTEGNLYNRTDLVDSKNSLKRTGYFEDVDITETRVNKDEINLNVDVKEAPTGSITGGIGYGSSDGILLNAAVADRNVFGSGMRGEISGERSKKQLSGRISLTNPRVFDSQYSLGGAIYANDFKWSNYREKSQGFSVTAGRKIGRYTSVSLTYLLERSQIEGLDEFYGLAGYQNGKNLKSSIIPAINFDNTDDFYIPRSGIIANTSLEYAGIGGDIKFTKLKGAFNWYFGLRDYIDWDIILRYKAAASYIWDTGNKSELPVNEKLFLGGMKTIRGYDGRSIPKKRYCIQNKGCKYIEVGGLKSFNNSFEISFPLINRLNMRFVTFFDYGFIGDSSWTEETRYSAGAGIEWLTPIGPLQLYFVEPLNKKEYDDTSRFEFTIGHRF